MDIREQITINGVMVRLQPYTELRHKKLEQLDKEVDKYTNENPGMTFRDMPRDKKAEFWMKRAKILWEPQPELDRDGNIKRSLAKPFDENLPADYWDKEEKFFTKAFFEDEAFEYPLLEKTQIFFLTQEFFL